MSETSRLWRAGGAVLAAALALGASGCAPPPSFAFFHDENNRRLLQIDCYRRMTYCLEAAEEQCNGKYRLVSHEASHDKMLAIVQCDRDARAGG